MAPARLCLCSCLQGRNRKPGARSAQVLCAGSGVRLDPQSQKGQCTSTLALEEQLCRGCAGAMFMTSSAVLSQSPAAAPWSPSPHPQCFPWSGAELPFWLSPRSLLLPALGVLRPGPAWQELLTSKGRKALLWPSQAARAGQPGQLLEFSRAALSHSLGERHAARLLHSSRAQQSRPWPTVKAPAERLLGAAD